MPFEKLISFFNNFLLQSDEGSVTNILEADRDTSQTLLAKPGNRKNRSGKPHGWSLKTLRRNEMVLSENNAGYTAVAMVLNLALVAGVFAGVVAAISTLAA